MIFLLPLLIIVAIVFSIDYIYFKDKDGQIEIKKEYQESNSTLEKEKQKYLKNLFQIK